MALLALATFRVGQAAQNARDIVARSLLQDHEAWPIAAQYTYQESQITKQLDGAGRVTETTTELRDILFLGGKRYEHLLQRNGKPLTGNEARKEQAKFDQAAVEASRLTPAERDRRFAEFLRERAKQRDQLQGIPDAYTFNLLGQPPLNGRACYLVSAQPRLNYKGKNGKFLTHLGGKIWIDQADYQWVRVEADVLEDLSFGLFLAKLSKGTHLTLERVRINNEVWLPKEIHVKVSARALVKTFRLERTMTYSNFRKYSTESRVVPEAEAK